MMVLYETFTINRLFNLHEILIEVFGWLDNEKSFLPGTTMTLWQFWPMAVAALIIGFTDYVRAGSI